MRGPYDGGAKCDNLTVMGTRGHAALALAAWICSGCGKSEDVKADADGGGGESIGEVRGSPFVVRSVSANYQRTGPPAWIAIGLTTQSGTECGPVHEGGWAIEVYAYSPTGPVLPGTYPVVSDPMGKSFADARLHTFGAACTELGVTDAAGGPIESGTITITATEPRVTGSFDVVIGGVHLAGPFDAKLCEDDGGPMAVGLLDACR